MNPFDKGAPSSPAAGDAERIRVTTGKDKDGTEIFVLEWGKPDEQGVRQSIGLTHDRALDPLIRIGVLPHSVALRVIPRVGVNFMRAEKPFLLRNPEHTRDFEVAINGLRMRGGETHKYVFKTGIRFRDPKNLRIEKVAVRKSELGTLFCFPTPEQENAQMPPAEAVEHLNRSGHFRPGFRLVLVDEFYLVAEEQAEDGRYVSRRQVCLITASPAEIERFIQPCLAAAPGEPEAGTASATPAGGATAGQTPKIARIEIVRKETERFCIVRLIGEDGQAVDEFLARKELNNKFQRPDLFPPEFLIRISALNDAILIERRDRREPVIRLPLDNPENVGKAEAELNRIVVRDS